MSTLKYKMCENSHVRRDIQFVVSDQLESLSDFVRRIAHEKKLSYRKIAEKSGGLITHSTVSDVINGRVINLQSQSVTGLAKGLGVLETEIYSRISGETISEEDLERIELEAMYRKRRNLSPAKKEAFKRILDMVDRELDRLHEEEMAELERQKKSQTNGKS